MKNKNNKRKATLHIDGRDDRYSGWTNRSISLLVAFLLILGYVDLGTFTILKYGFRFTVRGPLFWRQTSGLPPYLHEIPEGIGGQAYLKLAAVVVYLLLTDQAYIASGSVVASGMVLAVNSSLFDWKVIKNALSSKKISAFQNMVLFILNLVIGIGLMSPDRVFTITSTRFDPLFYIIFNVSGSSIQRVQRLLPSQLTLPKDIPTLKLLNVIIGLLMTMQLVRVAYFSIGRGGELGFGVTGDLLAMKINGGKVP